MMAKRIIARLDIKAPNLIKGIHLEGLRVMGDPANHALEYYTQGIDELIYMDVVASLYGRNSIANLVRSTAQNVFVPLTVGGGIRSLDDVDAMLQSGADKIAVNTAALKNPKLIESIAMRFGSQCCVVSIEAKRKNNGWEAYYDNGREPSGIDVLAWCKQSQDLGAGEILLTSVDQEGTRKGFDIELVQLVESSVSIPVIASGGCGEINHIKQLFTNTNASAVALADMLHYKRHMVGDIKKTLLQSAISVREIET